MWPIRKALFTFLIVFVVAVRIGWIDRPWLGLLVSRSEAELMRTKELTHTRTYTNSIPRCCLGRVQAEWTRAVPVNRYDEARKKNFHDVWSDDSSETRNAFCTRYDMTIAFHIWIIILVNEMRMAIRWAISRFSRHRSTHAAREWLKCEWVNWCWMFSIREIGILSSILLVYGLDTCVEMKWGNENIASPFWLFLWRK